LLVARPVPPNAAASFSLSLSVILSEAKDLKMRRPSPLAAVIVAEILRASG
jgi:hypothetical protein